MRIRSVAMAGIMAALAGMGVAQADFREGLAALAQQDYATAFNEFNMAATQGSAEAQYSLAQMYESGQGVEQDFSAALNWYRKAADQGFELAQNNIGYMYENGEGVRINPTLAAQWYKKAAEQGYALAQFNLGRMYAEGSGVSRDYIQSYFWTALAATQGDANAKRNMGLLASRMNSGQIASAQQLLALWLRQRTQPAQPPQETPAPQEDTGGALRI